MNGQELKDFIIKYENPNIAPYYRGIYSVFDFVHDKDIVSIDLNDKNIYILNTVRTAEDRGGHWLGVFGDPSEGKSLFIDSFGLDPLAYSVDLPEKLFEMSGGMKSYGKLPFKIQASSSHMCGLYVIFFALKFCSNNGEIAENVEDYGFSKHKGKQNDRHLLDFFRFRYGLSDEQVECLYRDRQGACVNLKQLLSDVPHDSELE